MFFLYYFAIVVIAVAVEGQEYQESAIDLINDVTEVVLAKKSKTCVIFVCDGLVQFVATEPESRQLFKKLGVPLEKVEILKDTYESENPIDILTKLAKLRSEHKIFAVYFSEAPNSQPQQPIPLPGNLSNTPLPKLITKQIEDLIQVDKAKDIVILVQDGNVRFISREADAEELFNKNDVNPSEIDNIWITLDMSNTGMVMDKFNEHYQTRPNFVIYFKDVKPTVHKVHTRIGLLVPEHLLYDIDDLLLVKKSKTVVVFVSDGKVKFAATEADSANKLAEFGLSRDKLDVIKESFESLNAFDILRKLSQLRYDSDTFLVHFTEVPGSQFPEFSTLINDISNVVLVQKSKTCVILVSDGRIQFVTPENNVAQKLKELGIRTAGIEVIRDTFEPKSPFDILGKVSQIRNTRDTFLVYFTEGKPAQTPGYIFPQQLIDDINEILLAKKSKTVAIYVFDGKIEFVSTEPEAAGKLAELDPPTNLQKLKDTFQPLDPFDVLGKLNKHLSQSNTFLIIFTEAAATQVPEITNLVDDISTVILQQNSKTCVIYVSDGKIMFVTSERDAPKRIVEFNVPTKTIETLRENYEKRNPFDIVGKLAKLRSTRNTFLVYFTEGVNVHITGPHRPQQPNFQLPGYQYLYPAYQAYGYYPQLQYPAYHMAQMPPSGSVTIETTKPNGGIAGILQKTSGLTVGDKGVIPVALDFMGLKANKKVVKKINFG